MLYTSRADPGFQVRGAYLTKLRRAEGGAKIFGVFRVKNHDFTPKNHIFSSFRGARAGCAPPPTPPATAPVHNCSCVVQMIVHNITLKCVSNS